MKEFRLSPRLYAIARAAESGRHIVDVGTDHGYIPVWLALRGQTERITATDIRPGPLERAMRSAEAHGVESRIRFVLCDGLSYDGASAADSVIIAGMGGETIISILAGAPWTKSGTRLILQPQTRQDELCVWLAGGVPPGRRGSGGGCRQAIRHHFRPWGRRFAPACVYRGCPGGKPRSSVAVLAGRAHSRPPKGCRGTGPGQERNRWPLGGRQASAAAKHKGGNITWQR